MRADPANTLVVCIDVVVSPRSSQDLRPKRRPHAKTWEDIEELVSKEHKRVRERAATQIGGASAGDGEQVSLILAGGVREATPKKAKKPAAKDAASITEIFDDDAKRTKPGGVLGDIDFEYIMWGYSQKVQLAGVCCSELVLHTWSTWPPCFECLRRRLVVFKLASIILSLTLTIFTHCAVQAVTSVSHGTHCLTLTRCIGTCAKC